MTKHIIHAMVLSGVLTASPLLAQVTPDPFPQPINTTDAVIRVNYTEFASLPDVNGQAARMMLLIDEPGTRRLFVNDMFGIVYTVSYDGKTVTPYLDLRDAKWNVNVQSAGNERGFQSFAVHPQFNQRGAGGFGKFYTMTDTSNMSVAGDYKPTSTTRTHDTVLLEWTAKDPTAATYDGGAPLRDADFGLLYMGFADGGSGGDPMKMAQNLSLPFGKILRLDPLGSNSTNGKYGIPAANPFVSDGKPETLGEIYAYGVRNPQHIFWDPKNGNMFMAATALCRAPG